MPVEIIPFRPHHREALLELSLRAWAPVFPLVREDVPDFVCRSFWPDGWETRQRSDLAQVLDDTPGEVDVAVSDEVPVGWVCTRLHPEDSMGEVFVVAVAPEVQNRGVGRMLLEHAETRVRAAGMSMIMVETGGDRGHAPARSLYRSEGYVRWPVARYFKDLAD